MTDEVVVKAGIDTPWTLHFTELGCGVIKSASGEDIALVLQKGDNQTDVRLDTGNLMVSAPILYATLHKIFSIAEAGGSISEIREIHDNHSGAVTIQIKRNEAAQAQYLAEFEKLERERMLSQ